MSAPLFSSTAAMIVGVGADASHRFSKPTLTEIEIVEGLGVAGDAHAGRLVQHRYSARKNPTAANLRQVHLIPAELLDEVKALGFLVRPGELGENVTTRGLDLASLPRGTLLRLGDQAVVELTGLRMPCVLIDRFQMGLKSRLIDHDAQGARILKAGVMSVARASGFVRQGDAIGLALPAPPYDKLREV